MVSTLSEIRNVRIEKLQKLRKMGIDPYPSRAQRTQKNQELIEGFKKLEGKSVVVVGRIMAWRDLGAITFARVQDVSGQIQLILRKGALGRFNKAKQTLGWEELSLVDIGDFIEASGKLMKSKTGEISVEVEELKLLAKSLRPLPEKWEGLKDVETILRKRYLDMTMDPAVKELFVLKSKFWGSMRKFLTENGFLEIRTPVLEHTTGGADARPFVTHHNALDTDFYLRISLELPLKRAIGGGFERVFEIGPVFRNEGIDDEHLQDYDMMEFYMAYADYKDGMELVEEMYKTIAKEVFDTQKFTIGEFKVDLSKKWELIDYCESIKKRFKVNVLTATEKELLKKIKEQKLKFEANPNRERMVDTLWKQIRREVAGPAFLINQPKLVSPLAKSKSDNPNITDRYQIILAGSEMGNGYSELNDPIDQYERFKSQQALREAGDEEAQMLDLDFVEMLEYGMPPTTGFGVSERLFSFLVNKPIRHTVMFPQMKRYEDPINRKLYC